MEKQNKKPDIFFKVLIVGESGVGKTTLLTVIVGDSPPQYKPLPTLAMEFKQKTIELENNQTAEIQFWDTPGTSRLRAFTKNQWHNADAFLILYARSNPKTFEVLKNEIFPEVEEATSNALKILVANKADESEMVPTAEGKKLAEQYGAEFVTTSAKTLVGIEECLQLLTHCLSKRVQGNQQKQQEPGVVQLSSPPPSKRTKDGCC